MEVQELALGKPPEKLFAVQGKLNRQDPFRRPAGRDIGITAPLQLAPVEPPRGNREHGLEPAGSASVPASRGRRSISENACDTLLGRTGSK